MRLSPLGLIAALLFPTLAGADEPKRAPGTETIPATGFAVISLNVAQLWDSAELTGLRKALQDGKLHYQKELKAEIGLDLADIERLTVSIPAAPFENGEVTPPIFYVTARKPLDTAKLMKATKAIPIDEARRADPGIPDEIQGKSVYLRLPRQLYVAIDDRSFAITEVGQRAKTAVQLLADLKAGNPEQKGPLAEALALASKHTLVAAVDFAPARKILQKEGEPEAAEFKPFIKMMQAERGLLTIDLGRSFALSGKLTFFDPETAQKLEPTTKEVFEVCRAVLGKRLKEKGRDAETRAVVDPLLAFADAALGKAVTKRDSKTLTITLGGDIDTALKKSIDAFPAWAAVASERIQTTNNLKQLGIAMHSYHDTYGYLPRDIVDKNGKAILSWRVELLPFVEQANLYNLLDRTKPWDDPANKKVFEQMPAVFKVVGREPKEKGFTYFQSFTSPKAVADGSPLLVPGVKRTFAAVTDGLSNTLMIVDGAEAVNWLKPGDLPYDPKKLPKIGREGWYFSVFGDGSVRRMKIPKDDVLKALITVDGGEVITLDD